MTKFHDPVRGLNLTGGVVTAENVAAFNRSDDVVDVVLNVYAPGDSPPLEVGAVEGGTMHYVRSVDSFVASASDLLGYVAPDAPALFRRPIPEIRARAATSRYWAQRLRWLRKRGRA